MELIFISNFKNEKFISAFKTALQEFSVDSSKLESYIEEFNAAGNIFAYVLVNEKGESIGMIQFQKTELSNDYIKEEYGFIREFWIAPDYRKQGYGTMLLKEAENYFSKSGIDCAILFSRPEAEVFYQKQGYSKKTNTIAFNGMAVYEKTLIYEDHSS